MDSPTLHGRVVLVVDDDPAVRGLYVAVLREAGATVISSGVATEAIALSELRPLDVVITDLRMPGHDGIWLLGQLKARMPAVPVIVVSGYIEPSSREHLLDLGFAEVLSKPLPLAELAASAARLAASALAADGTPPVTRP